PCERARAASWQDDHRSSSPTFLQQILLRYLDHRHDCVTYTVTKREANRILRRAFMAATAQLVVYCSARQAFSQDAPMKDTVISTATIRMGIIEAGQGLIILLCHGFPETKYAWRYQIEALA